MYEGYTATVYTYDGTRSDMIIYRTTDGDREVIQTRDNKDKRWPILLSLYWRNTAGDPLILVGETRIAELEESPVQLLVRSWLGV